jgi:hypothetical protein
MTDGAIRVLGGKTMKAFATLTVTGVAGVILFKLLATLLFPLLGVFFGLLAMTIKFAVIAAVVFFVYSMIRKRKEADAA